MKTINKISIKDVCDILINRFRTNELLIKETFESIDINFQQRLILCIIEKHRLGDRSNMAWFICFYKDIESLKKQERFPFIDINYLKDYTLKEKQRLDTELEILRKYVLEQIKFLIHKSGALQQGSLF